MMVAAGEVVKSIVDDSDDGCGGNDGLDVDGEHSWLDMLSLGFKTIENFESKAVGLLLMVLLFPTYFQSDVLPLDKEHSILS
ncbi:hypothetical protein V6N13_007698 [Hibiscus sabdariffa]